MANKKRAKKLFKLFLDMKVVDEYIFNTLKAFDVDTQLGNLQGAIMSDIPNMIIEDVLGCKDVVAYFGRYRTESGFLIDQAWQCVYEADSYPDILQELYRLEGIRECLKAREPKKSDKLSAEEALKKYESLTQDEDVL